VRLPGVRTGRSVSLVVGSLVLGPHRLLLAVGRYPILDSDLSGAGDPGQTIELGAEGVHLHVDVESVFPR
jgi:hypothetical protein